jgi:hypothetical protein
MTFQLFKLTVTWKIKNASNYLKMLKEIFIMIQKGENNHIPLNRLNVESLTNVS